jgi:hypothetical protein
LETLSPIFIYPLFSRYCGICFISLAPSFHFSSTKPLISLAPSFHFSSTKPLISLAPSFPQGQPKIYTGLRDAVIAPPPSHGRDNATCNIARSGRGVITFLMRNGHMVDARRRPKHYVATRFDPYFIQIRRQMRYPRHGHCRNRLCVLS